MRTSLTNDMTMPALGPFFDHPTRPRPRPLTPTPTPTPTGEHHEHLDHRDCTRRDGT